MVAVVVVTAASEFAAVDVMNSTTSVGVKSATNFHSCRSSYHYRTTASHHHHHHHRITSVAARSGTANNENKSIAANNRTMDSLNYWKRAFGNPEQTLTLGEKMIRIGGGIQQLNAVNNNFPLNSCFPVIKGMLNNYFLKT